jgi:hypothetical protein
MTSFSAVTVRSKHYSIAISGSICEHFLIYYLLNTRINKPHKDVYFPYSFGLCRGSPFGRRGAESGRDRPRRRAVRRAAAGRRMRWRGGSGGQSAAFAAMMS